MKSSRISGITNVIQLKGVSTKAVKENKKILVNQTAKSFYTYRSKRLITNVKDDIVTAETGAYMYYVLRILYCTETVLEQVEDEDGWEAIDKVI